MWCGRELSDNGAITRLCAKVRAIAAPLFRKGKTERAPHLEQCFEAWLAEVRRTDDAQDGGSYQALPVLEAIAAGRMPLDDVK